jgi:DnaJ-class molecular chaperone
MIETLEPAAKPVTKSVVVTCDRCNGTQKEPAEWDIATGAIIAFQPCCSCLGSGRVLANAAA